MSWKASEETNRSASGTGIQACNVGFCERNHLPTSAYRICEDAPAAKAALAHFQPPYVVKADGLAAGKGVVIAQDRAAAEAAIDDVFGGGFGAAGARVVLEEFLMQQVLMVQILQYQVQH